MGLLLFNSLLSIFSSFSSLNCQDRQMVIRIQASLSSSLGYSKTIFAAEGIFAGGFNPG
jgi:hypothetical protein